MRFAAITKRQSLFFLYMCGSRSVNVWTLNCKLQGVHWHRLWRLSGKFDSLHIRNSFFKYQCQSFSSSHSYSFHPSIHSVPHNWTSDIASWNTDPQGQWSTTLYVEKLIGRVHFSTDRCTQDKSQLFSPQFAKCWILLSNRDSRWKEVQLLAVCSSNSIGVLYLDLRLDAGKLE